MANIACFKKLVSEFWVVEGIDGSGKSTLVRALKTHLEDRGFIVYCLKFPSATVDVATASAEVFATDRLQTINTLVKVLKSKLGKIAVLADRWIFSGLVYACLTQGKKVTLENIHEIDRQLPKPTKIYFCFTSPEDAMLAVTQRNLPLSKYENLPALCRAATLFAVTMEKVAPVFCSNIIYHTPGLF